MWKSFVCASVAAVMLRAYDPFRTGQTALYHVKYDTDWHGFEVVPFILMGIMGVSRNLLSSRYLLTSSRAYMAGCSSS